MSPSASNKILTLGHDSPLKNTEDRLGRSSSVLKAVCLVSPRSPRLLGGQPRQPGQTGQAHQQAGSCSLASRQPLHTGSRHMPSNASNSHLALLLHQTNSRLINILSEFSLLIFYGPVLRKNAHLIIMFQR